MYSQCIPSKGKACRCHPGTRHKRPNLQFYSSNDQPHNCSSAATRNGLKRRWCMPGRALFSRSSGVVRCRTTWFDSLMVDIFRFFSIFLCTRSVRSYFLVLDSMCVLDVQMGCNGVVVGLSSSIDAGVLGGVGGAWEFASVLVSVKRGPDAFVLIC